jgi:NADPH2:quinone reductase
MYEGRSWQAAEFGEPKDVMKVVRTTWSEPPEGQLLVQVRAAGVGLADVLQVRGSYPGATPPVVPGLEVAGEVVATAPGSRFAAGDRVMGITPAAMAEPHGGYSDYAYVFEAKALPIPASLSFQEAAGFVIPFRTAYQALAERVQVAPGEVLAILGAGGAVGSAAIQLGKAFGATVIAVASTADKLKFCADAGADHGVDHSEADVAAELDRLTGGAGVDVLLDLVGGELATHALQGVGRGGRVPMAGYASGSFLTVDPLDLLLRNYAVVGVYAGGTTTEEDAAAWQRLLELVDNGAIRTPIGTVSGFDEVPGVLSRLTSGGPAGKQIIDIS